MRLDAKTVAALTLGGKTDAIFFDDTLTGFGYRLRLGTGGKVLRSWIAQYRRAGASRRMLIGSADVVSVEQARAKAKKVLAAVALGEDPQADKAERRGKDRLTVRAVVDQFMDDKKPDWRAQTERDNRRYLTGSYFAPLHSMAIDKVTRRDVASRIIVVKRQHGPIVAAAARAKLSAFFTWAMRQGLVEHNPTIGIEPPKRTASRERVLSDAELVAIWNACRDDDYGRIVRLLILLGARRQEVGGMAWGELDDLDAPQPTWMLPAKRSKNGHSHTLPLLPAAVEIIRPVRRMVTRDRLFGSVAAGGFMGWDKGKLGLDERAGISAPWVLHDIRRSVASKMGDLGIMPHVIEAVLGHRGGFQAGVAGIYNKSGYEREVRTALALWEDHIRVLVAGGARKVIPYAHTVAQTAS